MSCLFSFSSAICQAPSINWSKNMGGSDYERHSPKIIRTTDNKLIVGFNTNSTDYDIQCNHGDMDFWLAKLNEQGQIEQSRCFGGSATDCISSICKTYDGGYILGGVSNSQDGDLLNLNVGVEFSSIGWVIKIDSLLNIVWKKKYDYQNNPRSIAENINHEILVAGGGFVVTKLNESGDSLWSRDYGGLTPIDPNQPLYEVVDDIISLSNGGFCLVGHTSSNDGDVTGNNGDRCWVVNINSTGNIVWQKCLKTTGYSSGGYSIKKVINGGFVIAGYINPTGSDQANAFVTKLDEFGSIEWEYEYGGSEEDQATDIELTQDGGFIFSGFTSSSDGDIQILKGIVDTWIVKLSPLGIIEWEKTFGGYNDINTAEQHPASIIETGINDYVFATTNAEYDGDVINNYGLDDTWLVRLSSTNQLMENESKNETICYPNPIIDELNIKFQSAIIPHQIEIYDNLFRVIGSYDTEKAEFEIDMSYLSSGSYFIKIDGELRLMEKF